MNDQVLYTDCLATYAARAPSNRTSHPLELCHSTPLWRLERLSARKALPGALLEA